MPCIWGRHNQSQLFTPVAVFDKSAIQPLSGVAPAAQKIHAFNALIDTGAQTTMISPNVASMVGLTPTGIIPVQGVGGIQHHNSYLFTIGFMLGAAGPGQTVSSGQLYMLSKIIEGTEINIRDADFDVLLGMDIIGIGSLKVDGDGSFSFSF